MRSSLRTLTAVSLFISLSSCGATYDVGTLDRTIGCTFDEDCIEDGACDFATRTCRPRPASRNIDILFLIDNSASMAPKQAMLVRDISKFLQRLDEAGADYHIGFVTSDIGSWAGPGSFWGTPVNGCNSFEGDDGLLQAAACKSRSPKVTPDAQNVCAMLCRDTRFVPTDGKPYLSKVGGVTNVPAAWDIDMVTGKRIDRGIERAFACMGLVGDGGCGTEGQLEAVKRSLDGHRPENAGFLRPGSTLAVIFLTDEDDCSIKMSERLQNDPVTMDCATPDFDAPTSCFNTDYRCTARSIKCDQPMNVAGVKTNCKARASFLESEATYVWFLKRLRPPGRLFVGGIWSLGPLDGGDAMSAGLTVYHSALGKTSPLLNRKPSFCATSEYGTVSSNPQLRLSKFSRAFSAHEEADLCRPDDYAASLDGMAQRIVRMAGL